MGLIYYCKGDIEGANFYHEKAISADFTRESFHQMAKKNIMAYRKEFHMNLTTIDTIFFSKLSLPLRIKKKKENEVKDRKSKLAKIRSFVSGA